ncbi:SDR family oxidoreductase [Candidatus Saccharibacteria bacterium]|nr:SDR family oxidoreductase [Candidatus Saccharibacteria bacterium]
MNIVVIGASGRTGRELVQQGIKLGHTITAFVRNKNAFLPIKSLIVAVGDVTDAASLNSALKGQDAVLVALGPKGLDKTTLYTTFVKNVIPAMHKNNISRIIDLSALGAGDSRPQAKILARIIFATMLKNIYKDKDAAESLLINSDLEYTLVRPGRLLNLPAKGNVRATLDNHSAHLSSAIQRADVAAFMLEQLGSDKWVRKAPLIGY